jgi:hypothetical protein
MEKEKFLEIIELQKDIKNIPNKELVYNMETLIYEFERVKEMIVANTNYLDNIEYMYNSFLKEYQSRNI